MCNVNGIMVEGLEVSVSDREPNPPPPNRPLPIDSLSGQRGGNLIHEDFCLDRGNGLGSGNFRPDGGSRFGPKTCPSTGVSGKSQRKKSWKYRMSTGDSPAH